MLTYKLPKTMMMEDRGVVFFRVKIFLGSVDESIISRKKKRFGLYYYAACITTNGNWYQIHVIKLKTTPYRIGSPI